MNQKLKYFSFVVVSLLGACSQKTDDSSKIESGYYLAESSDNFEIPLVSFFVGSDGKMYSFEVKRIVWQDNSRYDIFAKGGNVNHYSSGAIPGSVSTRSNGQAITHQETSIYYPIDSDHVRVELSKSQSTPAWSDKKQYTFKKVSSQEFKTKFKAEALKIVVSNDDLMADRLTKEQTEFCTINFGQSCADAVK